MTVYFLKQDRAGNNRKLKKSNPLLYPDSWEYIKFYARLEVYKQRLMRKNRYFSDPEEDVNYVYMPLHLIPESTTFTLSPMYINELTVIEAVSKSLPAGWWLYVKEHQAMVGERGVEFYEAVNRLPNVKMVQLNYYTDPKPWLIKSKGVITLSGTSAYEAALLGKPSIVFSDVIFSIIDSINRVNSFEELPKLIKAFDGSINNIDSCAAYLATIEEMGYRIDLKYLMSQGQRIIEGADTIDEKYIQQLDELEELFISGYNNWNKEENA